MNEKIIVPALGESITEATVSKWLKNKGERYSGIVSTTDLFTTILDYAGVNKPNYLPGSSLRPVVNGSDFHRDKIIHYIKNPRVPGDPWANDSTGYSYRTNRWHFLWVPERDFMELYDVKKDPFEQKELSKDSIGVISMINREIITWNEEILNKAIFPQ